MPPISHLDSSPYADTLSPNALGKDDKFYHKIFISNV